MLLTLEATKERKINEEIDQNKEEIAEIDHRILHIQTVLENFLKDKTHEGLTEEIKKDTDRLQMF